MGDFDKAVVAAVPLLRHVAWKLTRDRQAVDDLVQETVMKALGARETYQDAGKLNAWLCTIVRTTFLNQVRGNARKAELLAANAHLLCPDEPVGDGHQEAAVLMGEVGAVLGRLLPMHRFVLVNDALGDDYHEMANAQAVPIGTIKSRLNRARAALFREFA